MKTLLMSIKPAYSSRIFDGSKAFELRRTAVKVSAGDLVVVYASSPTRAVVGSFTVRGVIRKRPRNLWKEHRARLGVTAAEFFEYFAGKEIAHAIEVCDVRKLAPVTLDALRGRVPRFRPPQSYMTWTRSASILTVGNLPHGARAKRSRRRRAP